MLILGKTLKAFYAPFSKGIKRGTDGKAENEMEMRSGKRKMGNRNRNRNSNRNRIERGLAAGNACHCFCRSCSRLKLCSRFDTPRPHSLHIDGTLSCRPTHSHPLPPTTTHSSSALQSNVAFYFLRPLHKTICQTTSEKLSSLQGG